MPDNTSNWPPRRPRSLNPFPWIWWLFVGFWFIIEWLFIGFWFITVRFSNIAARLIIFIFIGISTLIAIYEIGQVIFLDPESIGKSFEQTREIAAAKRELCRLKKVCMFFSEYRQQCATAGNFEKCLQVKLGVDNYSMIDNCNENGTLRWDENKMPNEARCFVLMVNSGFSR